MLMGVQFIYILAALTVLSSRHGMCTWTVVAVLSTTSSGVSEVICTGAKVMEEVLVFVYCLEGEPCHTKCT